MKLTNWTVMQKKDNSHYYIYRYDELDNEEKEDIVEADDQLLDQRDWIADDYLEIFSAVCEDNNAHGMASHIATDIRNGLIKAGIGLGNGEAGTIFVKEFVKDYMKEAGWDY